MARLQQEHIITGSPRQTVSNGCEGPAAQITMNIYAVITNNNVAATQTICYNTAPAGLTGTAPAGGTGVYTYQWQNSADNVTFNNIGGATGANYAPPALTATTWYRRIVNSGPCANISGSIQITVYTNLTPGTIQSAQSICYNTAPAQLTQATAPTGGTGAYTYQWQDSPDNVTFTNIGGATASSYSPPVLTANRYYRTKSYQRSMRYGKQPINTYHCLCRSDTGQRRERPDYLLQHSSRPAYTAHCTHRRTRWLCLSVAKFSRQRHMVKYRRGNSCNIQSAGTHCQHLLQAQGHKRCLCTGLQRFSTYYRLGPSLQPGTIGTAQSICYNTAPAALTQLTAPTGGTGVYTYQWQDSPDNVTFNNIGGATGVGYAPPVLTATRYYRRNVTSGTCGTVSSASVTITVYGNLTAGTVQSAQTICYNTAPAQLTQATAPTGGTGAYTYQWQDSPDNVTFYKYRRRYSLQLFTSCTNGKQVLQAKSNKRNLRNSKQRFNTHYSLCKPHSRYCRLTSDYLL